MKSYTKFTLFVGLLLLWRIGWSQEIDIDFQNVSYTSSPVSELCFDVYMRAGAGYPGGTPWTSANIRMDFDLITVSGAPVLGTGTVSNVNNTYLGGTPGTQTSVPGNPPGSYDYEYGLTLSRGSASDLPAVYTLMFRVCIPVMGGTFQETPGTLQMRTAATSSGSSWSSATSPGVRRVFAPQDMQEPLPIELLLFEPRVDKCALSLYWETASEKELGYYEVEVSKDGQRFKVIEQKKPESANSSSLRTYKYAVPQGYEGYYYRLKAVDLDGAFQYSPIVFAEAPCGKQYDMKLYPNPNYLEELTVEISSAEAQPQIQLVLLDPLGKVIRIHKVDIIQGANKIPVDTEALPSGAYYIRILGIPQLTQPIQFIKAKF